jgi:hypothetical protein
MMFIAGFYLWNDEKLCCSCKVIVFYFSDRLCVKRCVKLSPHKHKLCASGRLRVKQPVPHN